MYYRTNSYAEGTFDVFYFEKNLQGDIIGVYNSSGTLLALYDYDAWGNCTAQYASGATSTGVVYNPFRYRGYYYDIDLGLYYLNSRYYDPNTGRFISSDRQLNNGLVGLNQFAYCEGNPIRYTDRDGRDADENCTWDPDDGAIDLDGLGISACQPTYGATDSSAYGTYQIRCKVAAGDAKLGGYHFGGGSYMGGFTAQFATGGFVSVTDSMAVDNGSNCHGNSKSSTKPQHGYEIYEKSTGKVMKTGISGQSLNSNGTSPRANRQVNSYNKVAGYDRYGARVVISNMPGRRFALAWEKYNADRLRGLGHPMTFHKIP